MFHKRGPGYGGLSKSVTIKAKDFEHVVEKFRFETRDSGDRLACFTYEGRMVLGTRRSHIKGQELPFQHQIRQQLHLSEDQFRYAASCRMSREQYVNILRDKGIL